MKAPDGQGVSVFDRTGALAGKGGAQEGLIAGDRKADRYIVSVVDVDRGHESFDPGARIDVALLGDRWRIPAGREVTGIKLIPAHHGLGFPIGIVIDRVRSIEISITHNGIHDAISDHIGSGQAEVPIPLVRIARGAEAIHRDSFCVERSAGEIQGKGADGIAAG